MSFIDREFATFLTHIAPDAGPNQREMMRDAFFAGASTVMRVLTKIGDDDSVGEDEGGMVLTELEEEIAAWGSAKK